MSVKILWAMVIALAGCRSSSSSSPSSIESAPIVLTGYLSTERGEPLPQAQIHVEYLPGEVLGTSDPNGSFRLVLDRARVRRIEKAYHDRFKRLSPDAFRLVFRFEHPQITLLGASDPIDFAAAQDVSWPEIVLGAPAGISGTVSRSPMANVPIEARGAAVVGATGEVTTGDKGEFALSGVPAGKARIFIKDASGAIGSFAAELKPGQALALSSPIVVYDETAVTGSLNARAFDPSVEGARERPFRREFDVEPSPEAKFVRYALDRASLDAMPLAEGWHATDRTMSYDFPGDGQYTLYYQFADAAKNRVSPVLSAPIAIDALSLSEGLVIEDGLGVLPSPNATISIDVPPGATKMRLHHDRALLRKLAFSGVASIYDYTFPEPADGISSEARLYLQFADDFGHESIVYEAKATLTVSAAFPSDARGFMINDGSPTASSRETTLALTPPARAEFYRLSEGAPPKAHDGWIAVRSSVPYTIQGTGLVTLYVQYRTGRNESPSYAQTVEYVPFPQGSAAFVIGNGQGLTADPIVNVAIQVPQPAVAMLIWVVAEGESDPVSPAIWQEPSELAQITLPTPGLYSVYVQFRNAYGDVSSAIKRSVVYDPQGGS